MPRVSEPHRSFALSPHPPGVVFTMYEMWGSPQNEGSLHQKARKMYEKWGSPHQNMDSMMPRNISAILHCRVTCRYIHVDNSKEIQPAYIFMILCGDPHISYKNHGIECKLGWKTRRPPLFVQAIGQFIANWPENAETSASRTIASAWSMSFSNASTAACQSRPEALCGSPRSSPPRRSWR